MKHKIKIVGFDLDGTLLTTDKKLTDYTRSVMNEAIKKGIILVPATGRPLSGVPKELLEFEGIHYIVTSNGARIVKDRKAVYEKFLPVEAARKVLKVFEDYETMQEIYYDGKGYTKETSFQEISRYIKAPAMAEYIWKTRTQIPDIWEKFETENRPLDKVQALFINQEEKADAWKRIEALGDVEVTGAIANNIEVNAYDVHKGNAMVWLAESLGYSKEEVMAFGDGANDIKMIQSVGVGVAMENAIEPLKDTADLIAPSNDENGVAKMIEQYVL